MTTAQALINHYRKYFFVVPANTPELLNIAYHLRYKVYIEECGYHIGKNDFNEIEKDEYDDYSFHSLLFHRPSQEAIGYVRLIPNNKNSMDALPMEKYCKNLFIHPYSHETLHTSQTGEISRMALISKFRRRSNDTSVYGGTIHEENEGVHSRFTINYLPACLSFMSINLMTIANLNYSVAMMEKPLAILIKRIGIQHKQIGEFVKYHGLRAPFMIFPKETYDHLTPELKGLYDVINEELSPTEKSKEIII